MLLLTKAVKKERFKVATRINFVENVRLEIMADNSGTEGRRWRRK